jgi:hypothetical protein
MGNSRKVHLWANCSIPCGANSPLPARSPKEWLNTHPKDKCGSELEREPTDK